MAKFTLELECEDDDFAGTVFDRAKRVSACLVFVAECVETGATGLLIHDVNGNQIGKFAFED